jgi:hypothetical protein
VQHELLRIAQEAIHNAVCHAKPTTISVSLHRDVNKLETEQDIRQALSAGAKAFLVKGELRQEIAMGLVRQINIPGLRIQRMFSWALPSGELGGLPGEFYQFANSIRSELSAVSVRPLK